MIERRFLAKFDSGLEGGSNQKQKSGFASTGSEKAREAGRAKNSKKGFGSMTAEQRSEAGRKGGGKSRPSAEATRTKHTHSPARATPSGDRSFFNPQSPNYDPEKAAAAAQLGRDHGIFSSESPN